MPAVDPVTISSPAHTRELVRRGPTSPHAGLRHVKTGASGRTEGEGGGRRTRGRAARERETENAMGAACRAAGPVSRRLVYYDMLHERPPMLLLLLLLMLLMLLMLMLAWMRM